MLRKTIACTLAALLIGATPLMSFADDNLITKVEASDSGSSIEILEPAIGLSKKVMVREVLPISIRVNDEAELNVSFYRIPASVEMITEMLEGSKAHEVQEDLSHIQEALRSAFTEQATVSAPDSADVDIFKLENAMEAEVVAKPVISGAQAEEPSEQQNREEVIKWFNQAQQELFTATKACETALTEYENAQDELTRNPEDMKLQQDVEAAEGTYIVQLGAVEECKSEYNKALEAYQALFQKLIFGPERVESTGLYPYYNKVITDIQPGLYKLVFSSIETGEVVQVITFEVTRKEDMTLEEIKQVVPVINERIFKPGQVPEEPSTEE